MAGSVYTAPTEFMCCSLSTHRASRLLRILDNTNTRLISARGIRFVADGMVHLDATALLQSKTPSHMIDSGLRDALGRHAGTLQNLVGIESSNTIRDRLYLALTGTTAHTPLHCILCDMNVVDNNEHVRVCPALVQHRQLRFLLMAEALASLGDTLQHDVKLRFRPNATQRERVLDICSSTRIESFHEHTPIHTLPQARVLPPDAMNS